MNISTISYWFYEAFESMKKNMKNVLISISTMIATMFIIAVGYIVLMNANYMIEQKQEASSKIAAYFYYDVDEDAVNDVRYALINIGVEDIEYYASGEAIAYADSIKDGLLDGFDEAALLEICQPFFEITFDTVEEEKQIRDVLSKFQNEAGGIEDVRIPDSAVDTIKMAKSVRVIAAMAMVLIVELSVFLMINTTKLMLYSRRKEISIMKYVGAKDGFIKVPFAIEGIIMAMVAVLCVVIIVHLCYNPIIAAFTEKATYKFYSLDEIISNLNIMLILIGCFIGIFGSTVSMNKYLDV